MRDNKLNAKQREVVADSIVSWYQGESAFGFNFSEAVQYRLFTVVDRIRTGEYRDSDLAIAAAVIVHMPYTRPEDRTVMSFYAAQRKIGELARFTGVPGLTMCDERRKQLVRYIETLVEIENSGNKGSRHTMHISTPEKREPVYTLTIFQRVRHNLPGDCWAYFHHFFALDVMQNVESNKKNPVHKAIASAYRAALPKEAK